MTMTKQAIGSLQSKEEYHTTTPVPALVESRSQRQAPSSWHPPNRLSSCQERIRGSADRLVFNQQPFEFALDPKYKYDELRLAAIEGINDPRLLARITLESRWPAVQNAAFERLTDDERLADVASTCFHDPPTSPF